MTVPSYAAIRRALLLVLAGNPDGVRPRDAYSLVEAMLPQLTADDLARAQPDGRNAWHNTVQHIRYRLAEEGLVDRSEVGVWQLTPAGTAEAAALGATLMETIEPLPRVAEPAAGYEQTLPSEAVLQMLTSLLHEYSNDSLPWSAVVRDDGSVALSYAGRLRVIVLP